MIFILIGSMHDTSVLLYTLPASAYFVDRINAFRTRWRRRKARLWSLTPSMARLRVSLGSLPSQCSLEPGTRWLYVKVPSISREWHPFSITGPQDHAELHIKASGDWSQSLC